MGAQELSTMLWRERSLLDLLTFKLEEEQLLLTAGKTRWIQHATREVEQVVQQMQVASLERDMAVSTVAEEWGLPVDAGLRDIAAAAPEAWKDIFHSHLKAMSDQTRQIAALRDANEQFLRAAARSGQETIASIQREPGTYDASGRPQATAGGSSLLDQKL